MTAWEFAREGPVWKRRDMDKPSAKCPVSSLAFLCSTRTTCLLTSPILGKLRSKTALALCMEMRRLYPAPSDAMRPGPMRYLQPNVHRKGEEEASFKLCTGPASQKRGPQGLRTAGRAEKGDNLPGICAREGMKRAACMTRALQRNRERRSGARGARRGCWVRRKRIQMEPPERSCARPRPNGSGCITPGPIILGVSLRCSFDSPTAGHQTI